MLRSRFLWKLFAGYVFLILLATGLVGTLLALRVESQTLADIDRRLKAEAMLLRDIAATGLATPGESRLQPRLEAVGAEIGTRLTIIRADGRVVADSDEDPGRMDDHGERPEVLAARRDGIGTASRYSRTLDRRMRYLALPVEAGGELLGYARASLPLTVIADRLAELRNAVLLAAAAATAVALAIGFLAAGRVTRPLRSMAAATEAIAGGDYGGEVAIDSPDELGHLARAFNSMSRELRRSLATVEADRNKLEAILASMVEGVVAVDGDERIVHINEVARRLLGVEPGDVGGKPIWEVVRLSEVIETLSGAMRREEVVHRVVHLPVGQPPGVRPFAAPDRVLDLRASPLEAGGEELAGAVLVLEDVTQLRHLETLRRDFVGNVSHELKTPVTAIRGLVETLIDDPEVEPLRRLRFLSKIRNQADRLSNLLTDLLSLSRLESGGVGELEPLDVREAVEESVRSLRATAEERKIQVAVELPEEPAVVAGEEEALAQAVSNLLDNALKYTPQGGAVWVRVTEDADAVSTDAVSTDAVTVEVEDTGIGIEPRHRKRIFERFYRVDAARSRQLGGTGLGLAIVKHIALALGGEVAVDSVPGRGSTFRIRLPRAEAPED
jgi:two-component system phosphate regulon sensor histidine kinase PhoR